MSATWLPFFRGLFQSRRPGFGVCDSRQIGFNVKSLRFSPVDRDLGFATRPARLNCARVWAEFQSRRPGFGVCDTRGWACPCPYPVKFQSRRPGFGVCDKVSVDAGYCPDKFQSRRPGFGVCDHSPYVGKVYEDGRFQSRRPGFGVCDRRRDFCLSGCLTSFSPVDRDLGFATRR